MVYPTDALQGETVELARPWRRASMVELVREATGFDFVALQGQPLEAARAAGHEALERAAGASGDAPGKGAAQRKVAQCESLGHILNEVSDCLTRPQTALGLLSCLPAGEE